jgi:hypothetical protein
LFAWRKNDQSIFFNSIAGNATKKMDLNFKLFKGASIQFNEPETFAESAEVVAAMPAVKAMWPVKRYHIPEYEVHWAGDGDMGDQIKRRAPDDNFSPHLMTQVNQLRAKGFSGQGIKIAVVDTGVSPYCPNNSSPTWRLIECKDRLSTPVSGGLLWPGLPRELRL